MSTSLFTELWETPLTPRAPVQSSDWRVPSGGNCASYDRQIVGDRRTSHRLLRKPPLPSPAVLPAPDRRQGVRDRHQLPQLRPTLWGFAVALACPEAAAQRDGSTRYARVSSWCSRPGSAGSTALRSEMDHAAHLDGDADLVRTADRPGSPIQGTGGSSASVRRGASARPDNTWVTLEAAHGQVGH
jgi:hypothetical protein